MSDLKVKKMKETSSGAIATPTLFAICEFKESDIFSLPVVLFAKLVPKPQYIRVCM